MMPRAWFVASLLSIHGLISAQSSFSLADVPINQEATAKANRFRSVKLQPKQVFKNVRKLKKEVKWHKTLGLATAAAEKSGKPIVLVQALGDLTGYV